MSAAEDEIDLGRLIRTLWRGKWIIAAFVLLFAAAGYFYATEVADKEYVSTATVSLDNQQAQATDLDAIVGGISAEQPSLNTEIYLIRSRQLLRRLVESESLLEDGEFNPTLEEIDPYSIDGIRELVFGPTPPRSYTEEELIRIAVDRLRRQLRVTNPRQSFVFEISVSANSPQKATRLANALATTYINDQLLFKEGQSQDAIEFLAERTSALQVELNEAELEAKDFAASIELISPETLVAKNRQVKELRDRIDALAALIETLEAKGEQFDGFLVDTATADDVALLGSISLTQLFARLQDDPSQRDRFEILLASERSRAISELQQSRIQLGSLSTAVLSLEGEVDRESRDLLRLQQLQREAEAIGEIYGYFLARLKEAEVQQGTQQSDARLLSAAVLPLGASSPRVMIITAAAGLLGALLACGLVLLRETSRGGIRTAIELQAMTGVSVLGQIPLAPIRRRQKLIPYLTSKNNTPFSEAVRNLRTSMLLADPKTEPKLIMMTSSVPNEGKTTCAISLANSLVGMKKSVLLLEGDIRKSTQQQYFAKSTKADDSMFVVGESNLDDFDMTNSTVDFHQLGLAKTDENPADLFASDRFRALLKALKEKYDHVIIDAPPTLAVPDALIIGRHVDAILYAVGWDDTRKELVQAGLTEMSNVDLVPTGLILTKINGAKARSYGGAARYGSYYNDYRSGYYS